MMLVSLTGMMCSGKSTLVKRFPNASKWCIKDDFYEKHGLLDRGRMDWQLFKQVMPYHRRDLRHAIENAKGDLFFIEHTNGKYMQNTISDLQPQLSIKLLPPSLEEFYRRMKPRKDRRSNAELERYHREDSGRGLTIDEAESKIRGLL